MSVEAEIDQGSLRLSELEVRERLEDSDVLLVDGGPDGAPRRLSYADLKSCVSELVFNSLSLNEMAYARKEDYAKFAHGHAEYSDFWFFPSYGKDSGNKQYGGSDECIKIGTVSVVKRGEKTDIDVCVPKAKTEVIDRAGTYSTYHIGEIVPLAVDDFNEYLTQVCRYELSSYGGKENINVFSSTFDGFAIPNGAVIECAATEFQDACTLYSDKRQPIATSFRLPDMSGFFSLGPDYIQNVPYHNAVPSHLHEVKRDYSGQRIRFDFNSFTQSAASANSSETNYNSLHAGSSDTACSKAGCGKVFVNPYGFEFTNGRVTGFSVGQSDPGLDVESYPPHIIIPALVYIGKK